MEVVVADFEIAAELAEEVIGTELIGERAELIVLQVEKTEVCHVIQLLGCFSFEVIPAEVQYLEVCKPVDGLGDCAAETHAPDAELDDLVLRQRCARLQGPWGAVNENTLRLV